MLIFFLKTLNMNWKLLQKFQIIKKTAILPLILMYSAISSAQNYREVINNYLSKNLKKYDLLESDILEWKVTNEVYSKKTKVRHIYIQQLHKGIPVFNAVSNITIRESDNQVIFLGNSFVKNLASKVNSVTPALEPKMAITQVASALHLGSPKGIELKSEKGADSFVFSKSGISQEDIPVELVYQPLKDGSVKLSWLLNIYQLDGVHWWNVRVDAKSGVILQKNDWGVNCNFDISTGTHSHPTTTKKEERTSPVILIKKNVNFFESSQYNVFGLPVESPIHGPRTILTSPHNTLASPFGWHDTDGAVGAEYTITRGNNVYAHLDDDADNETFGHSPDGGPELNFNYALDLEGKTADTYADASITNLFYVNNVMHDIAYHYGFDETAGNFQVNNYGRAEFSTTSTSLPVAGDEVIADAQDASGTNNANFTSPPDGFKPRMQMYLFDDTSLNINSGSLAGKYAVNESRFSGVGLNASLTNKLLTADLALMNDDSENPTNGCSDSGLPVQGLEGKIAVIRSAGCSFVNKVQLAQDNNAVGVIVVSNGGNFIMGGETTTIDIPSVSVSKELGDALIAAIIAADLNFQTISATLSNIQIDGSLDNGIIAHEYAHGISGRLIGGAGNSNCVFNQETLREGWSDYYAVAVTMRPGDTETTLRGVGTFTTGESITGTGIRRYPYTTDMGVNPFTLKDAENQGFTNSDGDYVVSVHGVGSIWATMLWDLHWKMISVYGFDPDMYNGTGGNNKTMALVTEGLKLTPCNTGFVGARDAILAADEVLYGGIHQCLIWEVFARRGLGYSASSGETDSFTDQVEAFDMPPAEVLSAAACNALSLQDESLKNLKVYPNPATSSVNISLVNEIKNATTTIYDINGRQVYSKKSDLKGIVTINTSNLSTGIYILKINNQQISFSKKLVIN